MSWFFCFFLGCMGLNSIIVYNLLKRTGVECQDILFFGILCLISSLTFYAAAIEDSALILKNMNYNVSEIQQKY